MLAKAARRFGIDCAQSLLRRWTCRNPIAPNVSYWPRSPRHDRRQARQLLEQVPPCRSRRSVALNDPLQPFLLLTRSRRTTPR
jgi:hypothetical protein